MLQKRRADFAEAVWATSAKLVTENAPRIADDVIGRLFPVTVRAADDEGAGTMLRRGVIAAVKAVLNSLTSDAAQADFASIDPAFAPQVRALKRPTYFVTSRGEYVSVAELVKSPMLLDDARRFMRLKGEECIAEAGKLDELYAAVIAGPPLTEAAA